MTTCERVVCSCVLAADKNYVKFVSEARSIPKPSIEGGAFDARGPRGRLAGAIQGQSFKSRTHPTIYSVWWGLHVTARVVDDISLGV